MRGTIPSLTSSDMRLWKSNIVWSTPVSSSRWRIRKTRLGSPFKANFSDRRRSTRGLEPLLRFSLTFGNTSTRVRRFGFEARSESICDVNNGVFESERLTSTMACDFRQAQAQDEILKHPERERVRNFWKRYWEKKSEASTPKEGTTVTPGSLFRREQKAPPRPFKTIDSMPLSRAPSSSGVNVETMVVKSFISSPLRWTFRMASRAAYFLSASCRASSNDPTSRFASSSTRSSGEVPGRRCCRFQSSKRLPQKPQSSGVRRAASDQW